MPRICVIMCIENLEEHIQKTKIVFLVSRICILLVLRFPLEIKEKKYILDCVYIKQ